MLKEARMAVEERKYYVQCLSTSSHQGNQWRYGKESRPDRCADCGGPVDARLIEVDGERILEVDGEPDGDAHAIELERQGNEISEQWERDAEERYAGPEEEVQ